MKVRNSILLLSAAISISACSANKKPLAVVEVDNTVERGLGLSDVSHFRNNIGDRVYFAFNSSHLSHEAKERLKKQADWLIEHPAFFANIEGHCDEKGGDEYNLELGFKRAEAVRRFLLRHGVPSSRLVAVSAGKRQPILEGHDSEAAQENRCAITNITSTTF